MYSTRALQVQRITIHFVTLLFSNNNKILGMPKHLIFASINFNLVEYVSSNLKTSTKFHFIDAEFVGLLKLQHR